MQRDWERRSFAHLSGRSLRVCLCLLAALILQWASPLVTQSPGRHSEQPPGDWLVAALAGQETTVKLSPLATLHTLRPSDPQNQGVQLVWTVIPRDTFSLQARPLDEIGPANKLYELASPQNAILTINGGYYEVTPDHKNKTLGLLVADGKTLHRKKWSQGGGVLFSTGGPGASVVLNPGFHAPAGLKDAMESRPTLIEQGRIAVHPNSLKIAFNRMAIGTTTNGDLFIAAAFKDDLQAISLYDFSCFIGLLQSTRDIKLQNVINLDGAEGSHLFARGPSLQLGYRGTNYVPNVISILPRQP